MNTRGALSKNSALPEGLTPTSSQKSLIQLFERKLNDLSELFTEQLKAVEERIVQKIGDVAADIMNLRNDFKKLTDKVAVLDKRTDNMSTDIDNLKTAVNIIESDKIASDVIVYNLPSDVDAMSAAKKIVVAMAVSDSIICSAFRTKSNLQKSAQPVIIKLRSPIDRSMLFRAQAEFKRSNKRQLRLSDIGLSGDGAIVMHECLTSFNRELLNNALRFKKSQLLFSAFTLRGNVFVKKCAESAAVKITDITSLNNIVSGI